VVEVAKTVGGREQGIGLGNHPPGYNSDDATEVELSGWGRYAGGGEG
jgi:hypothetical protein